MADDDHIFSSFFLLGSFSAFLLIRKKKKKKQTRFRAGSSIYFPFWGRSLVASPRRGTCRVFSLFPPHRRRVFVFALARLSRSLVHPHTHTQIPVAMTTTQYPPTLLFFFFFFSTGPPQSIPNWFLFLLLTTRLCLSFVSGPGRGPLPNTSVNAIYSTKRQTYLLYFIFIYLIKKKGRNGRRRSARLQKSGRRRRLFRHHLPRTRRVYEQQRRTSANGKTRRTEADLSRRKFTTFRRHPKNLLVNLFYFPCCLKKITEIYAFLPREAVTRFLMQCADCQRRGNGASSVINPPSSIGPGAVASPATNGLLPSNQGVSPGSPTPPASPHTPANVTTATAAAPSAAAKSSHHLPPTPPQSSRHASTTTTSSSSSWSQQQLRYLGLGQASPIPPTPSSSLLMGLAVTTNNIDLSLPLTSTLLKRATLAGVSHQQLLGLDRAVS